MAGGAEDAFERIGSSGGAEGKAKAGNAVRAELFEGLVGVGFRVTTFVAIVIRKAIGKDDQEPIRCASLGLENFACTTNAGAEARVTRWLKLIEPARLTAPKRCPNVLIAGRWTACRPWDRNA